MQLNIEEKKNRVSSVLKSQWDEAGEGIHDKMTRDRIWQQIHRSVRGNVTKIYRMAAAGIAAAVLLTAGLLRYGHVSGRHDLHENCEWIAENSCTRILPDSTEVWMAAGSRLRYNGDFCEDRQVWLEGDATFDVEKRGNSTFRVFIDDSYIEVRGTVFSVRQNQGDAVTVSLYEGKIDFVSSVTGECLRLQPSQQVTYSRSQRTMLKEDFPEQIQWADGHYMLHQVSLPQLADFLCSHYGVCVKTDVTECASLKMTGMISFSEPLSSVLSNICFTLNLNCICDGDTYILKNTIQN